MPGRPGLSFSLSFHPSLPPHPLSTLIPLASLSSHCPFLSTPTLLERKEGKEEYIFSAFIQHLVSKRSDMDHTVLPANYTMPAFPL